MSKNEIFSEIFKNLDINNQMSSTCGQYEPLTPLVVGFWMKFNCALLDQSKNGIRKIHVI